jgi:DNA adenine methylase
MPAGRLPHPIPYQGSKRLLAERILARAGARRFERLYEPFAGSGAITIAGAAHGVAREYVLGDSLRPLCELWTAVLRDPERLAGEYALLWERGDYARVRERFNARGGAARLLYLLARCAKNAPRFNKAGEFNQSPDRRRRGVQPQRMRDQLVRASQLLVGRTAVRWADFEATVADATPADLVYLDPPWEGTSSGPDRRYHARLEREQLVAALHELDRRGIPYLLSYDGRHGSKRYGEWLPRSVAAVRHELHAGRSAQATLNGAHVTTFESLYVSDSLIAAGRIGGPEDVRSLPCAAGF